MKLFSVFFIILLMASIVSPSRAQAVDHWESLVLANDTWRYFVGTSEPPATWRQLTFNDTAWPQGQGGFGYGDNDDQTTIPATISVYLRIKFTITDLNSIGAAIFHLDYDDGFVAYLNDAEFARSTGLSGAYPAFDTPCSENHEANMFQGGQPTAFNLAPAALRQGENILAIQVHNQSSTSSDMSAIPFLSVGITTGARQYRPTPSWFAAPFVFQSSNLPIVVIDTGGQNIPNEPKLTSHMGIIANDTGQRNNLSDPFNNYDGAIGIEMRGNASQMFEKKPYTFETRNEDGSNNNVKLLGMPKDNDWILRAAYIDRTLMRDAVAYQMSRSIGRWAPRTRHVELVLNGEYQGVYILVEKIKPDNNRVDIAKFDSTGVTPETITGGYIWDVQQSDGTDIEFGERRVLKYPKADQVLPEQVDYIRDYDDAFRDVMNRSYYADPTRGYARYIDVSSFVDELLIQEATKNSDAYGWSGFFHKDRNGKICAGPAWDFDQSLSNSTHMQGDRVEMWVVENNDGSHPRFWEKLWATPKFKENVADAWFAYRKGPLSTQRLFAYVDSLAAYLNEAQQRNFQRWPILGVYTWRETAGYEERDTFQKEVDYMKDYIADHTEWMDEELSGFTTVKHAKTDQANVALTISLSPNPTQQGGTFAYTLDQSGYVSIKIYNLLGQEVQSLVNAQQTRGNHTLRWDGLDVAGESVSNGLYFYQLRLDGKPLLTSKFAKF